MNRGLILSVLFSAFFLVLVPVPPVRAETGAEAWLRYARLDRHTLQTLSDLPSAVVTLGDSPLLRSSKA